jgi:hypothetical protein
MGSISDYLEGQWANHFCGTAYTQPTTVYLALCTADPTDAGTGASMNEVANSNNYARVSCAFGAASARAIANSGVVTFNQASAAWGTVTHWAIVDSPTHGAGNMLAHGSVTPNKSVVLNNTPSFAAGQISVQVTAGVMVTSIANSMLDKTFRNQAYSQPATYIGLTTTNSSDSGAGTEVSTSGTAYARQIVNKVGGGSPAWSAISGGATSNAQAVSFATATGSFGTIVSMGIWDAASAGNLLFYDNSVQDQAVTTGDTVTFPIGDLDISFS